MPVIMVMVIVRVRLRRQGGEDRIGASDQPRQHARLLHHPVALRQDLRLAILHAQRGLDQRPLGR